MRYDLLLHKAPSASIEKILKYFFFLSNETKKTLSDIYRLLEEVYPGRWDVKIGISTQDFCIREDLVSYSIAKKGLIDFQPAYLSQSIFFIIHFPEKTISDGQYEHLMRDLFCFIEIRIGTSSFNPVITSIHVKRTTQTIQEYDSRYLFSHTNKSSLAYYHLNHCCLGTGEINMMIGNFNILRDINTFKMFLMHLDDYFEWESIEGGPYKRISDIYERNPFDISLAGKFGMLDDIADCIYSNTYNMDYQDYKLSIVFDSHEDAFKILDDDELSCLIVDLIIMHKSEYQEKLLCYCSDGLYFKIRSENTSKSRPVSEHKLLFRGEYVEYKLINPEKKTVKKPIIHPNHLDYVRTKIEKRITKDRIYSYINKTLSSS